MADTSMAGEVNVAGAERSLDKIVKSGTIKTLGGNIRYIQHIRYL